MNHLNNNTVFPYPQYTVQSIEELLDVFNTSLNGLESKQAADLIKIYGFNQLPDQTISWLPILWRQFYSLFIGLFFAIVLISFFLGEYFNGIVVLLLIVINTGVGFYQEYRASQALRLLKRYLIAYATTRRDSKEMEVETSKIVPGDILLFKAGDKIVADVRIIEEENLTIDESVLTGESVPVKKNAFVLEKEAASLFEAKNIGFAGTVITTGRAIGIVIATGIHTVIGNIAQTVEQTHAESTLVSGTAQLSRFIIKLVFITLLIIFFANVFLKGHTTSVGDLFIFSVALAVTAIPEALPVVVTFCLARGVNELAKKHVVVKRLAAVEDLGEIEILCTDKTGTLTENKMSVAVVFGGNPQEILQYAAAVASFAIERRHASRKDFDGAIWDYINEEQKEFVRNHKKIKEIPFDPERRRNLVLIHNNNYELIVRGAAEDVLELCMPLPTEDMLPLKQWIKDQSSYGNRILLVARRIISNVPEYLLEEEKDFTLLGGISFEDPLKSTTIEAVNKAKKLGLEIKVMSGDTPEVCASVGKKVGLITDESQVVTGKQLSLLFLNEQQRVIKKGVVFSRVSPDQKLLIIQTLQQDKIVGYMGDGINDALALKGANVSLAVQDAVALVRDTADIILLKKSLLVVVDGIQEGRKIVANTMKYIKTTLAGNVGNFYSVAIASLFIPFVPMLPLHILLINLICDFPMIAISTDTVDPISLRKPHSYTIRNILVIAIVLGIVSSLFDLITFMVFVPISPGILQTGWFIESILAQMVFIFSARSRQIFFRATMPSLTLLLLSSITAIVALVLPISSFGQTYLQFAVMDPRYFRWIITIVISYFVTTEIVKYWYYRVAGNFE